MRLYSCYYLFPATLSSGYSGVNYLRKGVTGQMMSSLMVGGLCEEVYHSLSSSRGDTGVSFVPVAGAYTAKTSLS